MTHDFDALFAVAHQLADAAAEAILPHFRQASLDTTTKSDAEYDPVTVADRASELAMRAILAQERPDDSILGEEFEPVTGTSGLTWVLDPIDGTRGFVSGTPTWGVLISCADDSGPIMGMIAQPYIGERFVGGGGQSYVRGPLGEHALKTRAPRALAEATVLTTFPEVGTAQERAGFEAVAQNTRLVRYGMDCYGYALLAAGQVDLVIEAGLQPYDIQAPIAVVEAAGGIVTDWNGAPAHNGGRALAAANTEIHRDALAILKGFT